MHPVAAPSNSCPCGGGCVATIIHDQLGAVMAFMGECEICALPVVFKAHSLPSNRDAGFGDGRSVIWVEKMLSFYLTSAPRSTRVSIRTAVWIVME